MLLAWLGLIATFLGATALYAATPHQKLLAAQTRPRAWAWAGTLAWIAGLVLLLNWAGPATAVFMALTSAMLCWSTLPLLFAWARHRKGDAA